MESPYIALDYSNDPDLPDRLEPVEGNAVTLALLDVTTGSDGRGGAIGAGFAGDDPTTVGTLIAAIPMVAAAIMEIGPINSGHTSILPRYAVLRVSYGFPPNTTSEATAFIAWLDDTGPHTDLNIPDKPAHRRGAGLLARTLLIGIIQYAEEHMDVLDDEDLAMLERYRSMIDGM